jgi:prepilin-type N-terminal cleavage/methylation domain-containing protein
MSGRFREGFSLIELLVVVAIIALLASIMLPGLSRAREYAYFSSCKSSLHQLSVGLLIYAGDNKGRPCEGYNRCNDGSWDTGTMHRRLGCNGALWGYTAGNDSLMRQLYDNTKPPKRWNGGTDNAFIGLPRLKGKYLPIEAFWDPIVSLRNWEMSKSGVTAWSGTEEGRDKASRRIDLMGYCLFVYSAGCQQYHENNGYQTHYSNGWDGSANNHDAEMPFRWNTNSRTVTTSHKAEVWLGASWTPGERKSWVSHFGVPKAYTGLYRFNIVHLDGHVDDTVWKELNTANIPDNGYLVPRTNNDRDRPYGWLWKGSTPSNPEDGRWNGTDEGIQDTPWCEGAFDTNP